MANTLDIKHSQLKYFSEQILVDYERLTVIMPESKKKLFHSKFKTCVLGVLTFDKLEQFIVANGGFIKDF